MTKFIKASEVITAIESLEKEVREEAQRTEEYVYKDAYLYGEDAIRLFFEKFTNGEYKYKFDWADKRVSDLKLKGSSKFVYIANVGLKTEGRKEGTIQGKMFNVAWYAEEKSGICELHIRMNWNHNMDTLRTLKEKGLLY